MRTCVLFVVFALLVGCNRDQPEGPITGPTDVEADSELARNLQALPMGVVLPTVHVGTTPNDDHVGIFATAVRLYVDDAYVMDIDAIAEGPRDASIPTMVEALGAAGLGEGGATDAILAVDSDLEMRLVGRLVASARQAGAINVRIGARQARDSHIVVNHHFGASEDRPALRITLALDGFHISGDIDPRWTQPIDGCDAPSPADGSGNAPTEGSGMATTAPAEGSADASPAPSSGDTPATSAAPATVCLRDLPTDSVTDRLDFAGLYDRLVTIANDPATTTTRIVVEADPAFRYGTVVEVIEAARFYRQPPGGADGLPSTGADLSGWQMGGVWDDGKADDPLDTRYILADDQPAPLFPRGDWAP